MIFSHYSVLLDESIDGLNIKPDGTYVDCTAGGGGHSAKILDKLTSDGLLICIDKDEEALHVCRERLSSGNVKFVHSDFKRLDQILDSLDIDGVDGILADLGVSSYQIDNPDRGFSYMASDAPLDMRMDTSQRLTAYEVVNTYGERQLYDIILDYGEEIFAKSIARNIVAARQNHSIETCGQLVAIIDKSIPYSSRKKGSHPAKRTFQALRIEVNKELNGLDGFISGAVDKLNPQGRIAIITFHSLEDRIVKRSFNDLATDCVCPSNLPICVCNHRAKGSLVNKKPILPSSKELQENSRSQSAKLRIFEKK
ncbi:MAG: 16S rRNA (cytosine(1402)-N(4))-methyltransferase RsmH [Clostridiales bacterium]|nr:16S rRNA (cytosine(1402)-N(4))-methyltransferase RsmH [Clostridiales bacterium]